MKEYLNPKWESFLKENKFSTFDELWNRDDEWFETPNRGRSKDGWSGVCKIQIGDETFFLKKQENFLTYSIKKPFGIAVAEKEFNNLQLFNKLDIPSMTVVYFGTRKHKGKLQAMVMTEDLKDYMSLSEVKSYWKKNTPALERKRKILDSVAELLLNAHKKNVMHYSLYPKHVFVRKSFVMEGDESSKPLSRFIDMEKALKASYKSKKQVRDLETLNRHCKTATKQDRIYFLLRYLGKEKADSEVRDYIRKIQAITKDS